MASKYTSIVLLAVLTGWVSAAEPPDGEQGFVSLFDGKSLDGWQGALTGYEAKEGVLACKKESGGNLYAKREYADFIFRFEFKLETGSNNGVGIRAPLEGDAAYVGMEIQILDDYHEQYKNLKDYQAHGSIYGVVPAKQGKLKPAGEWNSEEIVCQGRKVKVTLNGTVIVDADLDQAKILDGREHPGLKRESGYVGFLGHGSRVEFRNLQIKELK